MAPALLLKLLFLTSISPVFSQESVQFYDSDKKKIPAFVPTPLPAASVKQLQRAALTPGEINQLAGIIDLAHDLYDGPVDNEKMIQAAVQSMKDKIGKSNKDSALKGALRCLDRYCDYFSPVEKKERDDYRQSNDVITTGLVYGHKEIGKPPKVTYIVPGTAAEKNGIRIGDQIVAINGVSITKLDKDACDRLMSKESTEGSFVSVIVQRGSTYHFTTSLRFEKYHLRKVFSRLYGSVGYIQLDHFDKPGQEEFMQALPALLEIKDGARALIIDLRDNVGGKSGVMINLANQFLKQGQTFMYVVSRHKSLNEVVKIEKTGPYSDLPLVVLINNYTESAGELFAAALHDNGRAKIIGSSPSYGKSAGMDNFWDDEQGNIYITTMHAKRPNGDSYEGAGIQPDVSVTLTSDQKDDVRAKMIRQLAEGVASETPDPVLSKALEIANSRN